MHKGSAGNHSALGERSTSRKGSRHGRDQQGVFAQRTQKPINHCVGQSGKAPLYARAGENIPNLREDFAGDAEFDYSQLGEEQTGSRGTFSPRRTLEEDHAIEDDPSLRALGTHRFSGRFRLWDSSRATEKSRASSSSPMPLWATWSRNEERISLIEGSPATSFERTARIYV